MSEQFFRSNSGKLNNILFGRPFFISREFISHYLAYFSLRNLFFDPDPQGERSIPDLSVFYTWMLIPFLLSTRIFLKNRSQPLIKMFLLTILISPIPAALTRDPFYTLRILEFLWVLTIMVGFGIRGILDRIWNNFLKYSFILLVLIYSGISLYISYFILFKYERTTFNYSYMKLRERIEDSPNQKFVIDDSRNLAIGVRMAFFKRFNPDKLQNIFKTKFTDSYYSGNEFAEVYKLDNIEVRSINWPIDICREQILLGDLLAISDQQVSEHDLKLVFDIKDMARDITLKAYSTNPELSCAAKNKKS